MGNMEWRGPRRLFKGEGLVPLLSFIKKVLSLSNMSALKLYERGVITALVL
jgi:hypothetical protein